ncbi:unnamed protein product [Parajaminaea phylloscopi]
MVGWREQEGSTEPNATGKTTSWPCVPVRFTIDETLPFFTTSNTGLQVLPPNASRWALEVYSSLDGSWTPIGLRSSGRVHAERIFNAFGHIERALSVDDLPTQAAVGAHNGNTVSDPVDLPGEPRFLRKRETKIQAHSSVSGIGPKIERAWGIHGMPVRASTGENIIDEVSGTVDLPNEPHFLKARDTVIIPDQSASGVNPYLSLPRKAGMGVSVPLDDALRVLPAGLNGPREVTVKFGVFGITTIDDMRLCWRALGGDWRDFGDAKTRAQTWNHFVDLRQKDAAKGDVWGDGVDPSTLQLATVPRRQDKRTTARLAREAAAAAKKAAA